MKDNLTKEESAHLISLGVPKEKASGKISYGFLGYDPIFTLTDILEILPKEIIVSGFKLHLLIEFEEKLTHAYYYCYEGCNFRKEELIDSLYELLCWVITNKYIKL